MNLGFRDPGSEIRDPGVKKAPDPGSLATLVLGYKYVNMPYLNKDKFIWPPIFGSTGTYRQLGEDKVRSA